jgi:hypothetical protein
MLAINSFAAKPKPHRLRRPLPGNTQNFWMIIKLNGVKLKLLLEYSA